MGNLEVFSWRQENLTVGELTTLMRARGWEIRCLHNANKSDTADSKVQTSQFLLREEDAIPVGHSKVYGWKTNSRWAKRLARDFPSTTHSILIWLASYEVPLAQALLYHEAINPDEEEYIIPRGHKYLEAWRRASRRLAVSAMSHPVYKDWSEEFGQVLSLALLEVGNGLHDDSLKGEFIIRTEESTRNFNALDPDEERRELESPTEDTTDYMAEVRAFYAQFLEPYFGHPEGATQQEIEALEQKIGLRLPLAYKQYLRWMGKDAKGSNWERKGTELKWACQYNLDFDWQLTHRKVSSWGGAGRIYFFGDGEADHVAWFRLPKESENPPVYFLSGEEESETREVYDSFSEFVLNWLKWDYESALKYYERKL